MGGCAAGRSVSQSFDNSIIQLLVHAGGFKYSHCCGDRVFDPEREFCCEDDLNPSVSAVRAMPIGEKVVFECCFRPGSVSVYDIRAETCDLEPATKPCGRNEYDPMQQKCCQGMYQFIVSSDRQ
eukprot:GHVO01031905.1.p1 GENE.GHVO01031905.1~~GHVO01031905.1.p1  ORF type:complete len:124 (+),score=10.14 GHVO01031905.1:108-479(+)